MSNTLPWRTLATPATPSDLSAPSIALPWGSRMPDFSVTVTRAFMEVFALPARIRFQQLRRESVPGTEAEYRQPWPMNQGDGTPPGAGACHRAGQGPHPLGAPLPLQGEGKISSS